MSKRRIDALLRRRRGVLLDISLGGQPQPNAVTMQELWTTRRREHGITTAQARRVLPPALRLPFPLPDQCVHTAVVTHVLEYLDPSQFFQWWDELHRVMRVGGIVHVSGPYGADDSAGWLSDPTHKTRIVEPTFAFLDPTAPPYQTHASVGRPTPKPWRVMAFSRVPATFGTYSYNVTLTAVE